MKSVIALAAAIVAHALLIGLLMGMSLSPIVGVVLPLLVGAGGYRILDTLLGRQPAESSNTNGVRWTAGLGWAVALWCAVVIASVLVGISLRNGVVQIGPRTPMTISFIDLEAQPAGRVPELALVCAYYDRLEMSSRQRQALANALSDTTVPTDLLLATLKLYMDGESGLGYTKAKDFGVFEFHRGRSP